MFVFLLSRRYRCTFAEARDWESKDEGLEEGVRIRFCVLVSEDDDDDDADRWDCW